MGMIPKKTKSETKVFKGLTAARFLGLFVVMMISSMIGALLGGIIQWIFIAFSIIVYFVMTGRSPTNPTKPFAKGLASFISFKFDNKVFIGTTNEDYLEYVRKQEIADEKKRRKAEKKKG